MRDVKNPEDTSFLSDKSYDKDQKIFLHNLKPESFEVVYETAIEKLDYDSSRESIEQALTRYFKKNTATITLSLVGTCFYNWNAEPYALEKLTDNLSREDLSGTAEKIRKAKHSFYESLETVVQAEPYNLHDNNSILVLQTCLGE